MNNSIRLCLVLHNHQPIGNFGHVFEQAYQDSYLPFLEIFERYENIRISLHMSGPLARWLDEHHGDYLDRIKSLTLAGRVEMIGGGFYEPILPMLPPRDRTGQISSYTDWLQSRFDAKVEGAWIAERVWESCLTTDLANAGIQYTVLDDFHFRHAGVSEDQLHGYFVAEDAGNLVRVFPGSERLRYLIPFAEPHETVDYLRELADRHPGSVAVFGDDGEKFGVWPDTKKHVYEDGWLTRFLDLLDENRDWLHTSTLADAVENTPPLGKVFLPDASYREMTEWAMPVDKQINYEGLKHDLEHHPRNQDVQHLVRGGFWRNFKIRYPETNEMYARMMHVSEMLERVAEEHPRNLLLEQAKDHLYRGQCNCPYWHGAFGGLYLPHLRNANYAELIASENKIDEVVARPANWVEATADDYNFDGRPEVRFANEKLIGWLSPSNGGYLYELDVRSICHNLLATVDRRPEAYHEKVKRGADQNEGEAASIHDRVVFKQEGLDQLLQYDGHPRKSLVDHFFAEGVEISQVAEDSADKIGDFVGSAYDSVIRRGDDRVQVLLSRRGHVDGCELELSKAVTIRGGSDVIEIAYLIENLPQDRRFHFGAEFNFSGLPSGADDRFFHLGDGESIGQLQTQLDMPETKQLYLCDQWLGIDCGLTWNQNTSVWAFPIQTVSQSEGGFELVHQSVAVIPHWQVRGDDEGKWSVKMELSLDTRIAQSRKNNDQATVLA